MKSLLAAALLAACYSPQAPADVPCDPVAPHCPGAQRCVPAGSGFACSTGPGTTTDASVDAAPDAPSDDRDGDGVKNAVDNCPDVYNPDQGNEDGDRFGDACDPCPVEANDNPSDPDGDGVADDCDPNPNTPGDSIALFEGFHHGVPAAWDAQGAWSQDGDDVVADDKDGSDVTLTLPDPAGRHETVFAQLAMTTANTSPDIQLVGIVANYRANGTGVACTASRDASTGTPSIELSVAPAGTAITQNPWTWAPGDGLTMMLTRRNTQYTCDGFANANGEAKGNYGMFNDPASLQIAAYRAAIRVSWLLVIASP